MGSHNRIRLTRLWRWRFWIWSKFLFYQKPADAIFYPGTSWYDEFALQVRRWTGRRIPVIATLEGLAGDEDREQRLSSWAGHPVHCQRIDRGKQARIDRVLGQADHVIAISPFLAQMGARLYGDKFSIVPLGIDRNLFFPRKEAGAGPFTVVGAGRLYANKRPELFLEMARRFPAVSFAWFGEGELRQSLLMQAAALGLCNIRFPGAVPNRELGDFLRDANLFVLPSRSEGVPKSVQEASACGLPAIVCGYYETPSVVDGKNGFVVWNDEELFERIRQLVDDPDLAARMGARGADMAKEWDWQRIAPRWENEIIRIAESARP